jgi:hypothetical protein
MSTISEVPREALRQRSEWSALAGGATVGTFVPENIGDLPEPAQRWLTHAIQAGTPLWSSVELTMRGQIRLGRWRPFQARQILAPPHGFIWAATTRVAGLRVAGFDRYSSDSGEMRWRLLDHVPVLSAHGADVTRSAAGRLAAEGLTFVPTSFARAAWSADDTDTATAVVTIDEGQETVRLRVDASGRLCDVQLDRWGNPGGQPFGRYPFGVTVLGERTFGGITIPATLTAGWWHGTARQSEGEFFRATVTEAVFR